LTFFLQNVASKTDKVEATFEAAVMQFVKGDYPTCIAQLQEVQVFIPGYNPK